MAFQFAGRYIEALLKSSSGAARLLPGIPVIIRETDGTTLATTYEGRTKAAEAANPVITDASGNLDVWLDPGSYLGYPVIAGVEQSAFPMHVEIDPVEADAPSAADVTVTPAGGIVATNAQAALVGLDTAVTAEAAARVAGDALAIPLTQRGAANGVATLGADSKVPAAQIPAIALSEYLGTVASQAAMLALAGQIGDWAIRSDTGTTWVLVGADPTSLADWKQLATPTDVVTSVNGRIGAVVGLAEDSDLTAEAAARAAADALLVPKSLYDANSVVVAVNDDTPVAQQMAFFRVLGRMGGNIGALTGGDVKTLIGAGSASGVSTLDGSTRVVEPPKLHHADHEVGGADAFTGPLAGTTLEVSGKNGLSARRFSGRKGTAGAPTTGTWAVDDEVIDSAGVLWRCTVAGTPGTWIQVTPSGTSGAGTRVEPPYTMHPLMYGGTAAVGAANRTHYLRVMNNPGTFSVSKLAVFIASSTGNICLSVYRGTNAVAGPITRLATSGSVASPGNGYQEVSLGGSVSVDPLTDWFALSADNTSVTFGRNGAPGQNGNFALGMSYHEAAFPSPATATPTASWQIGFIIVGVA